MKVFKCNVCGNVVEMVAEGGGTLVCCGEDMELLVAKEDNEGNEKHLPVASINGNEVTVNVGSVEHPMLANHYIQFILVKAGDKVQKVSLKPEMKPTATFTVEETGTIEIYEYCNLHGLWKTTIQK